MKPAEELRAAAAKLRELADLATGEPWRYEPGPPRAEVIAENGGWIICTSLHIEDDDLRWIALMGPDNTPGVAALLEHYAKCVEWSDNWDDVHNCGKPMKQFARSILGESR
jgi:hypothetical protein